MRIEKDFLGEMELPDDYPFGIHTKRAQDNFMFSRAVMREDLFRNIIKVKKACATANFRAGLLEKEKADAILAACDILLAKTEPVAPSIHPFQGGAGTSSNMAANELIANYALVFSGKKYGEYCLISPLEDVNLSQSTNDVYPTAVRVSLLGALRKLHSSAEYFLSCLQKKEKEFSGILKIGRTELQDAMPISLGQEFSAWADAIARFRWRLDKAVDWIREVNISGTAVGTSINADKEYSAHVIEELRDITEEPLTLSRNLVDGTQNIDQIVEISGIVRSGAVSLKKFASDIRLLSSGPDCGLGELLLPSLQVGSSIMPGKVNPVIFEAAEQICLHVIALDHSVSTAASESNLELPQFLPYIAHVLLENFEMLSALILKLSESTLLISPNLEKIKMYIENSPAVATLLSPSIGHDRMSEIILKSRREGKSILDIIRSEKLIEPEKLEKLLRPEVMASPGMPILEENDEE
ncbi:aspartate ammonia-lyase [candidate division WOR-3 bacterium]|nr:aspartate ammonia-lyase [candidate division WOR-3 bacterium]